MANDLMRTDDTLEVVSVEDSAAILRKAAKKLYHHGDWLLSRKVNSIADYLDRLAVADTDELTQRGNR